MKTAGNTVNETVPPALKGVPQTDNLFEVCLAAQVHWPECGMEKSVSAGWQDAEGLSVGGDPVGGDHVLGGGEGDAMSAEKTVQCALEFVL